MLPLIYAVATSFKPIDELLIFPPTFFVRRPTIANYLSLPDLLSNLQVPLSRYIFNSLFISVATTVLYVIVSAMAAFVLSKAKFRGRNVIFLIIQFALMFNAYTLAVPQYLIVSKLHMIDTYWVYILPQLATTLGVFLMKQYIEGYIPDALLEAGFLVNRHAGYPAGMADSNAFCFPGYLGGGSQWDDFQRTDQNIAPDCDADHGRRDSPNGQCYGGDSHYDDSADYCVPHFAEQCGGSDEQRRHKGIRRQGTKGG